MLQGWVLGFTGGARNTRLKATTTRFPPEARGPQLCGHKEGAGSRARPGESQGVTGAAAAAAPASRSGSRDKVFFFSRFFWRGGRRLRGPMQAAVVHRIATGGANGRWLGLRRRRRGGGVGTLRTCLGRGWPRGAERSRAGGGEGGSPRRRRGRGRGALRAAAPVRALGAARAGLGLRAVLPRRSRGP